MKPEPRPKRPVPQGPVRLVEAILEALEHETDPARAKELRDKLNALKTKENK